MQSNQAPAGDPTGDQIGDWVDDVMMTCSKDVLAIVPEIWKVWVGLLTTVDRMTFLTLEQSLLLLTFAHEILVLRGMLLLVTLLLFGLQGTQIICSATANNKHEWLWARYIRSCHKYPDQQPPIQSLLWSPIEFIPFKLNDWTVDKKLKFWKVFVCGETGSLIVSLDQGKFSYFLDSQYKDSFHFMQKFLVILPGRGYQMATLLRCPGIQWFIMTGIYTFG